MSRSIVCNDLERIQRGRAARLPSKVDRTNFKKAIGLLILIIVLAMVHLQMQNQISQTSGKLASAQEDYLRYKNVERDLVQQVAGLKSPARIRRLAMAIGMVPPQDHKLAKANVYSAPWLENVSPESDIKQVKAVNSSNGEKISLWTKLLPFSSQAEAKTTN